MAVYDLDPEVLWGRRAFAQAQALLGGVSEPRFSDFIEIGWYDTDVHPESGSFAVVRQGGPYTDLVGEVLAIKRGTRPTVFAYCVGARAVPNDLALQRRAFLAVAGLATETVDVVVEVVTE